MTNLPEVKASEKRKAIDAYCNAMDDNLMISPSNLEKHIRDKSTVSSGEN